MSTEPIGLRFAARRDLLAETRAEGVPDVPRQVEPQWPLRLPSPRLAA
jgi:hypothetical protein